MTRFLAHFLFVLAAWTLTIKFIIPIAFSIAEARGLLHYVWWDFWWVAHLWLGWALLHHPRYLFTLAFVVAVVEVIIVVTKFYFFLAEPEWTMWTMNWFVNKIFVLVVFIAMLAHMARTPGSYRGPTAAPAPER